MEEEHSDDDEWEEVEEDEGEDRRDVRGLCRVCVEQVREEERKVLKTKILF